MNTPTGLADMPAIHEDTGTHHDFRLTTTWRVDAPVEQVWQAIEDADNWPAWWPYVRKVTVLVPGNSTGVGSVRRFYWRTALPYRLCLDVHVTAVQAPHAIDAQALGDLTGVGRWRLFRAGGLTLVRYQWEVSATRPWMRRLAPLARPLFEWNHRRVMHAGELGLRRWLARGAT